MMPPPGWGPGPFDDRDLDAVLAGEPADVPVALRPVADALAALRAAPTPAELVGEANAMAEFRALRLGQTGRPAGPAPTLQLPAVPAGEARRRSARYRGRRRGRRPASRRAGVLTAVAAAAAIVIAALFTGTLPGPIARLARITHSPTAASAHRGAGTNSASPKVETTSAAVEPTPPPVTSPAGSGNSAASTCRTYYGYYEHPATQSGWAEEKSLWHQLTQQAQSQDPRQVYQYCSAYVSDLFPHWTPALGHYPPLTGTGQDSQSRSYQGQPASGQQSGLHGN